MSSVVAQPKRIVGPPVQVNCLLTPAVVAGLDRLAQQAGTSRSAYAAALLNAAYTARCGQPTDIELDAAVGRVGVLIGAGLDIQAIADLIGLGPETVRRIHDGWIAELCGREVRHG